MQGEDPKDTQKNPEPEDGCEEVYETEKSKKENLELSAEECTSSPIEKGWNIMFH